jgi:hypothetical protein
MIARSRINPDNSLWSRPDFPQDYDLTLRSKQPDGKQATPTGRTWR